MEIKADLCQGCQQITGISITGYTTLEFPVATCTPNSYKVTEFSDGINSPIFALL